MNRPHDSQCEGWRVSLEQLQQAWSDNPWYRSRLFHHIKDVAVEWLREMMGECPNVHDGRPIKDEHEGGV